MTTRKELKSDIVTAMKAKEKEKVSILRMLDSKILYQLKEADVEELDENEIGVITSKFKADLEKEKEGIVKAGMDTASIDYQIEVISGYLPKMMSKAEVEAFIENYLKDHEAELAKLEIISE